MPVMTFSLLSLGFWTDDVSSNVIAALAGVVLAQGWRWARRLWTARRARGAVWADLREGVTFVLGGRYPREEMQAQLIVANHCTALGIDIDPDLYYADQDLEKILGRNLIVIHTATMADQPEKSVVHGWLQGWSHVPDLALDHDGEMTGYLVRLPNPHHPARSIVILSGPRKQSTRAAALWLADPAFSKDRHAASGRPFAHAVPFGLTQDVPFLRAVTGGYLTRDSTVDDDRVVVERVPGRPAA